MIAQRRTPASSSGRTRSIVAASAALILLLVGAALPLWTMTLHAPQYPQGLRLVIDGRGTHGDVDELNALNHYIGMSAIRAEEMTELRFFVPGIAVLALGMILVPFVPWRGFRGLVVLGAWTLPVAFLADLQWRLYAFGHSLDSGAAFRLPAFTPRALGPTAVMNFNVTAVPGIGLVFFVLSAAVLTAGLRLDPARAARRQTLAMAAAIGLVVAACAIASPSAARAAAPSGLPGFDLARAIAAAPAGATLEVPPGRYPGPIVLPRPISLRGLGRPVIDAGGRGDVVVITGDDVRLEGFEIRGSALAYSREAAGIVIRGARAVVRGNRIEDVLFGIYLTGAQDAVIETNTIATADLPLERRGHAVYLWKSQRVQLRDNRIMRGKDGIYVSFSDRNLVQGNWVSGCRYGVHYMYSHGNTFRSNIFRDNAVGAAVMYSTDVTLIGNIFEGSRSAATGAGLIFKDVDRLAIRENRIVRNRIGLEFDSAPATLDGWVRVERNLIAFNDVGFGLMSTAAITATENAIVENLRPVHARGAVRAEANQWSVGGRGNYWGDYAGFDHAGDGIGDVPYRRTDLLEDLAGRAPVLQAFLFTPAHHAVEAAARLVPLVRTAPVVHDPQPLMRPPVAALPPAPPRTGVGLLWIGLALLTPAVAGVATVRPRRRRRP